MTTKWKNTQIDSNQNEYKETLIDCKETQNNNIEIRKECKETENNIKLCSL